MHRIAGRKPCCPRVLRLLILGCSAIPFSVVWAGGLRGGGDKNAVALVQSGCSSAPVRGVPAYAACSAVQPEASPHPYLAPLSAANLPTCGDTMFSATFDDAVAVPCHRVGSTRVYTDRSAFLADLAIGAIQNPFDDVLPGASGELHYASAGFEYRIVVQFGAHNVLYNGAGFVSTASVDDDLVAFVSPFGVPVTAIGGNVWSSDLFLQPLGGPLELVLTDGTVEEIDSQGPGDFRGFITDQPLSALSIRVPADQSSPPASSADRWPTMDIRIIGVGR